MTEAPDLQELLLMELAESATAAFAGSLIEQRRLALPRRFSP
jgi:hypothetical protein